jgi:hypothetical protein
MEDTSAIIKLFVDTERREGNIDFPETTQHIISAKDFGSLKSSGPFKG